MMPGRPMMRVLLLLLATTCTLALVRAQDGVTVVRFRQIWDGDRVIPNDNWSSRNQNKLLFKGKYPRLYYWFAVRWLVKEVGIAKMWREKRRPYRRIIQESIKVAVARAGVFAVDLASFSRTAPQRAAGVGKS